MTDKERFTYIAVGPPNDLRIQWLAVFFTICFVTFTILVFYAWFPALSNACRRLLWQWSRKRAKAGKIDWRRYHLLLDDCEAKGITPLKPDEYPRATSVLVYFLEQHQKLQFQHNSSRKKGSPESHPLKTTLNSIEDPKEASKESLFRSREFAQLDTAPPPEAQAAAARESAGQAEADARWREAEAMRYDQRLHQKMNATAMLVRRHGWERFALSHLKESAKNRAQMPNPEEYRRRSLRLTDPVKNRIRHRGTGRRASRTRVASRASSGNEK